MVQLTEWMRMNVEVKERDAGNIPKTNLSVVQIVRGEHGILIYTKKTTVLQVPQHFIFLILIILWERSHLIPASFSFSSVRWTQSSLSLKLERKTALSHVRLLWSHELQPARLLCPWDSPGKNTGVGCHFLLQGNFPTQELNPGLPYCGQMPYWLGYTGDPRHVSKALYRAPNTECSIDFVCVCVLCVCVLSYVWLLRPQGM